MVSADVCLIFYHHASAKVMAFTRLARRFGNELYKFAFPIYRPLYRAFKSHADRVERDLLRRHLPGRGCGRRGGQHRRLFRISGQMPGTEGRGARFEPDPENFNRLHAALSTSPNIIMNQLAVGDRTEEALLYISDDLNVDHHVYPTKGESRRTLAIKTIELDDYFKPGKKVDFIKLDIQGFELHALRGAVESPRRKS